MSDWGDEFGGRKVVLTGACGVIGGWIAQAFAQAGARVCLSDRRGAALAALATTHDVTARGGLTHVKDLADSASIGIPMGRASAPADAPDAIMFLCSGKASYITGATLSVDGGNAIGSLTVYQDKKEPG